MKCESGSNTEETISEMNLFVCSIAHLLLKVFDGNEMLLATYANS
jgi:hypothetical protein